MPSRFFKRRCRKCCVRIRTFFRKYCSCFTSCSESCHCFGICSCLTVCCCAEEEEEAPREVSREATKEAPKEATNGATTRQITTNEVARVVSIKEENMAPARVSPPATPSKEVSNGIHARLSSPPPMRSSPVLQKSNSLSVRSQYTDIHSGADSTSLYYIRNTVQSLEKKGAAELGFGVFESISKTTFIQLVEYIANERLSSLPHRGSTW